jgi:hypothetical protein
MNVRNLLLRRGGGKKKENDDDDDDVVPKPDPPEQTTHTIPPRKPRIPQQSIELGTIEYCNLSKDGRHGDYDTAIRLATETGKPIFANFVEWSG